MSTGADEIPEQAIHGTLAIFAGLLSALPSPPSRRLPAKHHYLAFGRSILEGHLAAIQFHAVAPTSSSGFSLAAKVAPSRPGLA